MDQKYLEVEIEHLKKSIERLESKNEEQDETTRRAFEDLSKKLDKQAEQLGMYRHFVIFIRSLLAGLLIVLTVRFGDITAFLAEVLNSKG